MEIYTKDSDGNKITSPRFTQWDVGQKIYVSDWHYSKTKYESPIFQFGNRNTKMVVTDTAKFETDDNGEEVLVGNIPDVLLTEPYAINVYIYLPVRRQNENQSSDFDVKGSDFIETYEDVVTEANSAKTVFISTLEVEARLPVDNGINIENTQKSTITLQQLIDDFNKYQKYVDNTYSTKESHRELEDRHQELQDNHDGLQSDTEKSFDDVRDKMATKIELDDRLFGYSLIITTDTPTEDVDSDKKVITIVLDGEG